MTVCNGDASYTATYSRTYIEYTVTFYDEDGTVIATQTYHYGDQIVAPENPTKASDETYDYTFAGWDNPVGTCTGNASFYASYDETYIEYMVTFYDEDGTVIATQTYHYGDQIQDIAHPTKASDNVYSYHFNGWDSELGICTGNMEFTATYSRTYIEYTVTFYDEDGSVISTGTYHYGDQIVAPSDPTKASDETYDYTFAGWDNPVGICTGNAAFFATYTAEYNETYLSSLLREELLEEINKVNGSSLEAYSKLKEISSHLGELIDSDRAIVKASLDIKVAEYNSFIATINSEYEETKTIENKFFFGAIASILSFLGLAVLFLKRRAL